jgi:hypothetical protein
MSAAFQVLADRTHELALDPPPNLVQPFARQKLNQDRSLRIYSYYSRVEELVVQLARNPIAQYLARGRRVRAT